MQTFETAAVISLIDHLSAPLRKMADAVNTSGGHMASAYDKHAKQMIETGRHLSYQLTVPAVAFAKAGFEQAVEFSKAENTLKGAAINRARTLKDLKVSQDEYSASVLKMANASGAAAYTQTHGLSNDLKYQESFLAAYKAYGNENLAAAVATQSVGMAIATRMDQHETTDRLINLANMFGIVTKNADGTSKSVKELQPQLEKFSDIVSTMYSQSPMTGKEALESFTLSAPIAHQTKMDPAALAVISETLAESGIKGQQASTAERAYLLALAGPKASAVPTLLHAGVDYGKFATYKDDGNNLTGDNFREYAKQTGILIAQSEAASIFKKAGDAAKQHGSSLQAEIGPLMIGALRKAGSSKSPITPKQAQDLTNKFFQREVEGVDIVGITNAIRKAHMTAGELKLVMEGRQVPRIMSFLHEGENGEADIYDQNMKRMFGQDYEKKLEAQYKSGSNRPMAGAYDGNTERFMVEHAKGEEGAEIVMKNAMVHMNKTLFDAGVYKDIAKGLVLLAEGMDRLSKTSPEMIRFAAGATLFAAALGPLLFLGGNLMKFAGAIRAVTMALGAAGTLGGAAGGAGVIGAAAAGAGEAAAVAGTAASAAVLAGTAAVAAAGVGAAAGTIAVLEWWKGQHPDQFNGKGGGAEGYYRNHTDGRLLPGGAQGPNFKMVGGGRGAPGHLEYAPFASEHHEMFGPPMPTKAQTNAMRDARVKAAADALEGTHEAVKEAAQRQVRGPMAARPAATARPMFGGEGSGAYITAGFNHENSIVRMVDTIIGAHSAGRGGGKQEVAVEGNVSGSAQIMQTIKVDPSPMLTAIIQGAQAVTKMNLSGKLGTTMKGSNATLPAVSPGLSSFKPTLSGR